MRVRLRTTVRLRLTLLYGALFLVAGAVLLAINYALVRRNLPGDELVFRAPLPAPPGVTAPVPPPLPGFPPGEDALIIVNGEPATPEELEHLPVRLRQDALHELLVQSATALGLMAVASVGLGWAVAGRVLRPLQEVTAKARHLSEANLHERIGLQGPDDELKELADTFDSMLARLDAAFEAQRRFVANASHELRTPLAIMRAEVDVALADPDPTPAQLRSMAENVRLATERSERLIDSLLTLARSERGVERSEPVDLAEVAMAAVEAGRQAPAVVADGLRVDADLAPAPVCGDRALLERLVANLVENALTHNTPGGWVAVATSSDDGLARVRVTNSGPVVPTDAVESLFEPFRRVAADRTQSDRGAGLGLSIVRSVATAHGGQARAAAWADGGLDVIVELPADRPPS